MKGYFKILLGPLLAFIVTFFVDFGTDLSFVSYMAGIALWMAVWWMTEAVSLAVTAFLPFIFFPLLGISSAKDVAAQYMDPVIFLFIGGFIIAFSIEKWGLHERIALGVLKKLGGKSSHVLLGIMLSSYVLSMWMSNTATVMMLLSAVLAIISQLEKHHEHVISRNKFAAALLIGLSYSATIGGMATLVGSPPNMVFYKTYLNVYGDGSMDFFRWFSVGFPISILFLFCSYFLIKWYFINNTEFLQIEKNFFKDGYYKLGRITYEEKIISFVFIVTALLWFLRSDIVIGNCIIKGWTSFIPNGKNIEDGTIAVTMALLLFLIPSKSKKGKKLMEWGDVAKLPFDVLLLFGSGFALAKGFEDSGLSNWLAEKLFFLKGVPPLAIVFGICAVVALISEFASNVASIQLMLPILISVQKEMNVSPLLLLLPAALSASLGFMLPVATAPNTIVFSTKRIKVGDMMRLGFIMDVIGGILIASICLIKGF